MPGALPESFKGSPPAAATRTRNVWLAHGVTSATERGEKVKWTGMPLGDGKEAQTGETTADRWGLVTLQQVRVGKGKNRVRIER